MTPKQAYWTVVYLDLQDTLEGWKGIVANEQAEVAELKIRSEQWNKDVYFPKYEFALRKLNLMPARTELLTLAIEHAKMKAEEARDEAEANSDSGSEKLG